MLCFKKISGAKKIMDRKGEYHDFSSKIFYLTVPKKNCSGTLYCVINFGYRKISCFRGLCHDFPSIFFVSQNRNISWRNSFMLYFRKNLVAKKFMDRREGEVSRFSFENLLSHSAEKDRRGTLKGVTDFGYTIFRRIFFRLAVPKHFLEEPLYAVFQKILGIEKDYG